MKNKARRSLALIMIVILAMLLFTGCGKGEKIENLLQDAEHELSNGNYEEARACYKEALALDKENRDAQYGLEDLEKGAANKDQGLCHSIHDAIAYTIMDPSNDGKSVPTSGDYELQEYLNKCGESIKSTVLNDYMGVQTASELSDKLVSTNQTGNPIKGSEIRVGIYSLNEFSVYIPGSYDIGRDQIIYGGVLPK